MENKELVSVCVLTYNSMPYVEETLESIKAQTYENIELIVSDDCSKDDTIEFVKKWIDKNSVRFINAQIITTERNLGVSANYNRAINSCKGEWIKVIAGDDLLLSNCIDDNMAYVQLHKEIQILFSNVIIFYDDKDKEIEYKPASNCPLFFSMTAENQYEQLLIQENLSINPSSKFARRDTLINNPVDEIIKNIEDLQFNYDCTSKGIKIYHMDKFTVKYRKHAGALTGTPGRNLMSSAYIDSWITLYYIKRKPAFEKRKMDVSRYEKKVMWYLFIKHILKNKANVFTVALNKFVCKCQKF